MDIIEEDGQLEFQVRLLLYKNAQPKYPQNTNSQSMASVGQAAAEASQASSEPARRPTRKGRQKKPTNTAVKTTNTTGRSNTRNPKPRPVAPKQIKARKATTASQGEQSTDKPASIITYWLLEHCKCYKYLFFCC
ncbi:hypothetical protein PIB30_037725 [Stylosanthes scabra]|uniref:Uncharacterized protein n=1 Tax=Stylosanthes scabra TaxID=79078 RepID=A0ABU6RDW6_9FABA|nr:hypothetical protein [Stylosanthes scabra]